MSRSWYNRHVEPVQPFARAADLRGQRPQKLEICGTCCRPFSEEIPATDDHIAPKKWFNTPPPPNLPTWFVCYECQQELSPREERLRNLFASANSLNPKVFTGVYERTARSTRTIKPIGRRHVTTPAGLLVPAEIGAADPVDLYLVFRKITRGLYWYREQELPPDPRLVVRILTQRDHAELTKLLTYKDCGPQHLGEEFWWATIQDRSDPTWRLWLFTIYQAVGVGVWYGKAATEHVPDPSGITMRA